MSDELAKELTKIIDEKVVEVINSDPNIRAAISLMVHKKTISDLPDRIRKVFLDDEEIWMTLNGRIKEIAESYMNTTLWNRIIDKLDAKIAKRFHGLRRTHASNYGPASKAFTRNYFPRGAEGWVCSHSSSRVGAPWNSKEEADLTDALKHFCEATAAKHRRGEHGIKYKLLDILKDC